MPTPAALSWWHDARFGMFIHWGLYSLLARHEWTMYQESIPPEEYKVLADRFNPQHYNPEAWVALAQDAGMRYMILTSRHHEGSASGTPRSPTSRRPRRPPSATCWPSS